MNKIGIFDSGIGGVTVLNEIIKVLPNEDYIYYSDSKHNPYGDKTEKEIFEYSQNIVKYLISKDCNVIVIACNTASAICANKLRKLYPEQIIVAIEPAYKMVHDYEPKGRTLVMATKRTIHSEKFNILFKKYDNHKTILLPCKGLADIIENGKKEEIKQYLSTILHDYKGKIDNVVLGCTHYPLIKDEIQEALERKINFFDGANRLAIHLKKLIPQENQGTGEIIFVDSSNIKGKEEKFLKKLKNF